MGKGQRWYLDYCSSWTSSLFFCLSTLLLVFYTCSKWQCWEALEHVCLSLPPEERGRHTVHPNNWVLKDIFKWPKCGLYLASQEIWASLKTSRRIYWEHVDPCTEKDGCLRGLPYRWGGPPTGGSPSMVGQSLCHCLGQMLNQVALPWALHSQGLLCSQQFQVTYYSGTSSYSVRAGLHENCMRTWQKSIENIYSAAPVFQGGYQLGRYNGSKICFWFFLFWGKCGKSAMFAK